jgi:hypothetical protein
MIKFLEVLTSALFGIFIVLLIGAMVYLPFYFFNKDSELDKTYKYHIWVKGIGNYRTNSYQIDGKCLTFTDRHGAYITVCGSDMEITKTH